MKDEVYGILIKAENRLVTKGGMPRLWPTLRGPAQIMGKGVTETSTHEIVKVKLTILGGN